MSFWSSAADVAQQVVILFLLMVVGAALAKLKWLTEVGAKEITKLLLTVVSVCVIMRSFLVVENTPGKLGEMGIAALASLLSVGIGAAFALPLFRRRGVAQRSVLQFGASFSNCGFMGLPLVDALLGAEGVFLVSIFIAVFQILVWTYGVILYRREGEKLSVVKALLNPGVIGVLLGLPFFLFRLPMPMVFSSAIEGLNNVNTPLAMIVTGFYLAHADLRPRKGDGPLWAVMALRLLVVPIVSFGLLYLFGVRGLPLVACMVPLCAPCASNTTLFAVMFEADAELSSRMVTQCTLLSIVTMPVLISLARMVA